mmetsp:Transcript_2083/g.3468  ORF Transcript_2083/g.3468 Transcript_2083/m.3468 type:complete len:201 (+) Transcript_2083:130-732(+)
MYVCGLYEQQACVFKHDLIFRFPPEMAIQGRYSGVFPLVFLFASYFQQSVPFHSLLLFNNAQQTEHIHSSIILNTHKDSLGDLYYTCRSHHGHLGLPQAAHFLSLFLSFFSAFFSKMMQMRTKIATKSMNRSSASQATSRLPRTAFSTSSWQSSTTYPQKTASPPYRLRLKDSHLADGKSQAARLVISMTVRAELSMPWR